MPRIAPLKSMTGAAVAVIGLLFAATAVAGTVQRVDAAQLETLIRAGIPVVDIRRADEWRATGVIPGSTLITAFDSAGQLEPDFLVRLRETVGDGKPLALICRSGNRSAAAARLIAEGDEVATIYDVAGGVRDWAASGHALVACPRC